MAKYSTKEIRQIFKEHNKTVGLDFEYKSSQDKVPYTCDLCGFEHSVRLNNLTKGSYGKGIADGQGCPDCREKREIDYSIPLGESFASEGYEIIEIEGDRLSKDCRIYYMCPKGHEYNVLKYYWYLGRRCPYCEELKKYPDKDIRLITFPADRDKITMCLIKEVAHDYGFRLLNVGRYDGNSLNKLDFECSCRGHKIKLSVDDLRNKKKCYICEKEDLFKEIRELFSNENYTLLIDLEKEYEDQQTFFECIHNKCDNKFKTNWNRFCYHGQRCPKCQSIISGIKRSGSNHFNWKDGISAEPYCFDWSSKEFKEYLLERDEYRCWGPECKGESERLVRHHIDHDKKNCDVMNIIVLCNSCNKLADYRTWYEEYFKNLNKNRFGELSREIENK